MTYEEEIEIVARIIKATQKLNKTIEGSSIYPFETLQALNESQEAFEDALETIEDAHPLRDQIKRNIEGIKRLRAMLTLQM